MYSPRVLLKAAAVLAIGLGAFPLLVQPLFLIIHPATPIMHFEFVELVPGVLSASVPLIGGAVGLWRPNLTVLAASHGWIAGHLPRLLQTLFTPIPAQIVQMLRASKDTVYVVGTNYIDSALTSFALIGLLLCAIAEAKNRSAVS